MDDVVKTEKEVEEVEEGWLRTRRVRKNVLRRVKEGQGGKMRGE